MKEELEEIMIRVTDNQQGIRITDARIDRNESEKLNEDYNSVNKIN